MKFDELATSLFFEKSNLFTYEHDGWIEYYPVVEARQEMFVEKDGQQYSVLEVSYATDPTNWRVGRVIVTVDSDGGYVEFALDDNIAFNIYSRTLEAIL